MKDDMIGLLIGFTFLAIILMGIILLPVLAVYALPFGVALVVYVKWRDSPTRKENEARAHLQAVYERTKAGTLAKFSQEDIDYQLSYELPGYVLGTPVEERLLEIGNRILKQLDIATNIPQPPSVAYGIEGGRYLDKIGRISTLSPDAVQDTIREVAKLLGYFGRFVPYEGGNYQISIRHFIKDVPRAVETIIDEFSKVEGLRPIYDRLEEALLEKNAVYPTAYKADDVVEVYLGRTPLEDLFDIEVGFGIPFETRFSHTHIIGGTGSGKTTLIESMIAEDIRAGNNVILIDGQGDIIQRVLAVAPLERVIHIDPSDVEYPLALNLFDVGQERFAAYSPLEREKAINRIVSLFNFVFNSFASDLTSKQDTLFSYLTILLLEIPNASVTTMLDILDTDGIEPYRQYLRALSPATQRFFDTDFNGPEFTTTKREVRRRVLGLMKIPTFERIFSHTKSKLSMYDVMNGDGNIILINTAKDLLQAQGHSLFGRMFIAMIMQATQERASTSQRKATFLYLDECYEYLDENVETLLETARKYRVGCILAHQYFGAQISASGRASINASTAIKFAGMVSGDDVSTMAKHLHTSVAELSSLPLYTFMAYFRGLGTMPFRGPSDPFSEMERNRVWELEDHREEMRKRFCIPAEGIIGNTVPNAHEEAVALRAGNVPPPPPKADGSTFEDRF